MKSCVVTANYACDPNKVWLYLTKPTLNGWRRDVSSYEESDDGLKAAEKNTDGSETQIVFTRKEKPRCLSCNFQKGKISGTFTALLLGGGDATSVECSRWMQRSGLFRQARKAPERASGDAPSRRWGRKALGLQPCRGRTCAARSLPMKARLPYTRGPGVPGPCKCSANIVRSCYLRGRIFFSPPAYRV